ncbi:MAG: twin-arginine translocase TatA/TatE family subunit [Candidatus Roseilinea sp.]|uniref:twin-arginine translocase TatA/TatE family subunit n=1 Tax=Candidatus Roseilinea sp. TaxID=2838777 RepID=UPI004049D9A3
MSGTILGIGPLELILIAVLVLLVFGPERLPTLMRQAGRAVRRLREFYVRFATDLRTELTPFEEEIKVLREVTDELRRDLAEIRDAADLRTAIQPIMIDTSVPANKAKSISSSSPIEAAPSSLASGPASNGAKSADIAQTAATNSTQPAAPAASAVQPAGVKTPAAPRAAGNSTAPVLAEDNPWTKLGQTARADALDDDNPWVAV